MRYKNKLIDVLKSTILLNTDHDLFSKKYDINLYPESRTYDDVIPPESKFEINSDTVFDRPIVHKPNNKNDFANRTESRSTALQHIGSSIKKNIDILPKNFNKITEKVTNIKNSLRSPESNIVVLDDNLPNLVQPVNPAATTQEPIPDSFRPVATSLKIHTNPPSPITTALKTPVDSFSPVATTQEPIPDSFSPVATTQEPIPDSFSPVATTQEPIPDSFSPGTIGSTPTTDYFSSSTTPLTTPIDSFSPVATTQEPIPDSFSPVATTQEPIPDSFSPVDKSILANEFLFPIEKINPIDTLKSSEFQRKIINGKYNPDVTEINKIKRNLFADIVGSGMLQNKLSTDLQEIPMFKDGGQFNASKVEFKAVAYNELGRGSNEKHIIKPDNTPFTSITNVNNKIDNALPIEIEKEITKSFMVLSDELKKIKQQTAPKKEDKPKQIYPHNQIRSTNKSILLYYNAFSG